MKFRHITRICTASSRSMLPPSRYALSRCHRYRFSSNLDNEKDNIVPSTANTKIKSIQNTLSNSLSLTEPTTFWSLIARNKEHRDWVKQYDVEMGNHKAFDLEFEHFSTYRTILQYLRSNAYNGMQRLRMRGLALFYYEEFMLGALNSFKAIQSLNSKDKIKISRCFTSNLYDDVESIQHALFECNAKKKRQSYEIANIVPFAGELYFVEGKGSPPDLEMNFNVRYYYSLKKNVEKEGKKRRKRSDKAESELVHKCADIEWRGYFEPQFSSDGNLEKFNLSDKGFLVHNVEVDGC